MNAVDASAGARATGVAAVQARIAALQARFGVNAPPAAPAGGSGSFDSLLAGLTSRGASSAGGYAGVLAGHHRIPGAGGLAPVVPDGTTGGHVVALAQQHLGTPYVWGGESPGGFDCSGLVQYTYRQLGVNLPRTSAEQARVGVPVAGLGEARPGDLVAFNSPVDHIGIYAGDGLMVVAPKRGDVVKVQRITSSPTAIRRVIP